MISKTHKTNITLPEIFDEVRRLNSKAEKVQMLKSCRNLRHMRWFVNATYNTDFSKAHVPRYTENQYPPDMCGNLWTQTKRIDAAFKSLHQGNTESYDRSLTLVLETLSKQEADLIVNMLQGKKVDGISKRMWREVYPEFFRTEEASETVEAGSQS